MLCPVRLCNSLFKTCRKKESESGVSCCSVQGFMPFINVRGRTPVLWGGSVTATGLPCVVVLLLVCSVLQGAGWWSHITQRDAAHLSRLGSGAYKAALIK
ncbi:unnamed protein product [Arctogadus glacialis]